MQTKINELVKQLHLQEMTFKTMVKSTATPAYFNKIMAGKIISHRMFLYFNENILRKQIRKNPTQYYYEYLTAIINNQYTNYRNLVLFEIKSLIENIADDLETKDIERMFLSDFHAAIFMTYKMIIKNELNVNLGMEYNSKEVIEMIDELDNYAPKKDYRIRFLLGAIAHVNNSISQDDLPEIVLMPQTEEKLKDKIMHQFNEFLDIIIGKYFVYDRPEYFISLLMLVIERDYDLLNILDE